MTEQSEINEILLRILRKGILRARAQGWAGRADLCAIEAEHIHNLPFLILNPNPQELEHYVNAPRVDFINRAGDVGEFGARLETPNELVQKNREPSAESAIYKALGGEAFLTRPGPSTNCLEPT